MDARLLVVDDELHVLQMLAHRLEEVGYEVHTASNGREALSVMGSVDVDLLITDLRMPELDGVALCRSVRAASATADLPIIVLTAIEGGRIPEELKDDLVVISKPIDTKRLLEAVQYSLETGRGGERRRPDAA